MTEVSALFAHVSGMVWASFPSTSWTGWAAFQTGYCGITSVNKGGDVFPAHRIYGLSAGHAGGGQSVLTDSQTALESLDALDLGRLG